MAYTRTIYLLVGFFVICIRETKQHFSIIFHLNQIRTSTWILDIELGI